MRSEIIVVLVLIALAVGFIIWVRVHSQRLDNQTRGDADGQQSTTKEG
ncbi:MAG: hypothetical protein ACJ74J_01665 [Blastocatellia bacterium]